MNPDLTLPYAPRFRAISAMFAGIALVAIGGCSSRGQMDETGGVQTVRSACPNAAIPANTGDITLFDPAGSTSASAIDVVATITNLRFTCTDNGSQYVTQATFDVLARRNNAGGARDVTLPYFSVVMRGGDELVSKRIGAVRISFAAGQDRASASGQASSSVDRAQATLPVEIERRIRKRRNAGDDDAALDPLAEPDVREAIKRTSYELLVGFNLTPDQLRYNATR